MRREKGMKYAVTLERSQVAAAISTYCYRYYVASGKKNTVVVSAVGYYAIHKCCCGKREMLCDDEQEKRPNPGWWCLVCHGNPSTIRL
jgi:hypothetical protein